MRASVNWILVDLGSFSDALRKRKTAMIGLIIILIFVLLALLAPWLAPYDPSAMNLKANLLPPSIQHPLGTDELGRDVLSRVIWGARVSLIVAVGSVLVGGIIGTSCGLIAGYFGKKVDAGLSWFFDLFYAFPILLLAIAFSVSFGRNLLNIICSVGLSLTPIFGRVVRSATLVIKNQSFIEAERGFGATEKDILIHHILPNVAGPLIVVATMTIVYAVLVEASLSYLGLGIPPPTPTWGIIVSSGKEYLRSKPWIISSGGLAIFFTVLGFNLFGDGIRDYLDPFKILK